MGWAYVQSKDSSSGSATFSSNTTTGNQIVVVNNAITASTGCSISPGGGTFTQVVSESGSGLSTDIWICGSVTGGTTPTVTVTGGSSPGITVYEFSGGTGTTDGTNHGHGSAASMTTGSITTGTNGDLVVKGFSCQGTPNGTAETGWTEINPNANGNVSGYIIQGTAGAITGTDTQTSNPYAGAIAAFKPASGGTVTLPSTTMNWNQGITAAPVKAILSTAQSLGFKMGVTAAPIKAILSTAQSLAFKAGITALAVRFQIPAVNLAWKAGVTAAPVRAILAGNMPFAVGITAAVLHGGGAPAAPTGVPYSFWGGGYS